MKKVGKSTKARVDPTPPSSPSAEEKKIKRPDKAHVFLPTMSPAEELQAVENGEAFDLMPQIKAKEAARKAASENEADEDLSKAFRTIVQIANETPAEVDWVIEGLIAAQSTSAITGWGKLGGKTQFTLGACKAIVTGEDFMDKPVKKGPVVYATEQSDNTFLPEVEKVRLEAEPDFHVLSWHKVPNASWSELCKALDRKVAETGAVLVVVDTWSKFARLQGDTENDPGPTNQALEPLQLLAATRCAVWIVVHDRKSGGEVGLSTRGTSAFTAGVDHVFQIARTASARRPNTRRLTYVGRLLGLIPEAFNVELSNGTYVNAGDNLEDQDATAILLAAAGDWINHKELGELLNGKTKGGEPKKLTGSQGELLNRLHKSERLERRGNGTKGSPFEYRRQA